MSDNILYARDLDGTGSMHVCSKGDPGAVAFAPVHQPDHPNREAIEEAFHDWWSKDGHAIDTEPDVSWYDKRRDFAEMAVQGVADAILEAFPAPADSNPAGFTVRIQQICEDRCAEVGDPACWRLPDMVEPCEHITPCEECIRDAAQEGRAIKSFTDKLEESLTVCLAQNCYWDETGGLEVEALKEAARDITNEILPLVLNQAAGMNLRALSFSTEGFAHTGLGTFYHIGPPDNGSVGYVLYRYEGSSKTGLGWHERREELEKVAMADHVRRIFLAYESPPDSEVL